MNKKEIEEVFHRVNLLSNLREQAPILLWAQAAGERLSALTDPLYVEDGTLYVRVTSSSAGAELRLKSGMIIKRLNELSGRPLIRRIKSEVGGKKAEEDD